MTGGGLDWIEAAVHLLRRAPAAAWARYYIGSLPFVAAVLFYWSDMSRNAFAWQSLTGGSLATAMAYLWMKCWQSAFAAELRFELEGGEPNQWSARRVGRMILFQTAVQPSGLFVIPAGLLMTIPFPAIMAFYQGFSMTGDGSGEEDLRATISRTLKLAGLWTRQNSAVLGILLVFGLFVFLNLAVGLLFVPELLRMYLGVDSVFTRAGANVLGSTFFAVCCGLTYLVLDPLLKAHGALRCFHGESVHTGADLRSQLRREMRRIQSGALVAAMLCCGAANTAAKAETLDPGRLDKSIGEVLKDRRYAWRLPRQRPEGGADRNVFIRFTEDVLRKISEGIKRAAEGIVWLLDKLFTKRLPSDQPRGREASGEYLRIWLYVLAGAVTLAAGVVWWRFGRRARAGIQMAVAPAVAVDLASEDVTADQLPEEGWRALASEWIAKGDLRMAMRALFLATLAHLGERERIRINAGKSNREYQRELTRKARGLDGLLSPFAANLSAFELAWYGGRNVDRTGFDGFAANVERIRAHA